MLRQEQAGYEFCQKQITECDQQLAQYLAQLDDRTEGATLPEETRKARRKKKKGNPQFNLREELFRMTGTDLTQIDGIDVMTAMTVLSEVGWDMSKWKTENNFVSWLKLCPDNKISGGKVIGKGRMPTNNRATVALKMAASNLRESDTYLGALPPIPKSAGTPGSHQGHGCRARPSGLPHAALRDEIPGPGSRVLRSPVPQTAGELPEATSRPARIANHRSCGPGLNQEEFLGRNKHRRTGIR